MSSRALPGLLLVLATMTGCTSLGRGSATGYDAGGDESIFGGSVDGGDGILADSAPPEQMEVAWQDGGTIRAMSGPGTARAQAVPQTKVKKSGKFAVVPAKN